MRVCVARRKQKCFRFGRPFPNRPEPMHFHATGHILSKRFGRNRQKGQKGVRLPVTRDWSFFPFACVIERRTTAFLDSVKVALQAAFGVAPFYSSPSCVDRASVYPRFLESFEARVHSRENETRQKEHRREPALHPLGELVGSQQILGDISYEYRNAFTFSRGTARWVGENEGEKRSESYSRTNDIGSACIVRVHIYYL